MEDIEDMFKNEEDQNEQRVPDFKRKIMRKNKAKKEPL